MRKILFICALFLVGCVSVPEVIVADNLCAQYTLVFVDSTNVETSQDVCTCARNPATVLTSIIGSVSGGKKIEKIVLVGVTTKCE